MYYRFEGGIQAGTNYRIQYEDNMGYHYGDQMQDITITMYTESQVVKIQNLKNMETHSPITKAQDTSVVHKSLPERPYVLPTLKE